MHESIIDILILAKRPERRKNLQFLLRLSNYQVLSINDDCEAFNYLIQRQAGSAPACLLLIDEADLRQPFLQILPELKRCQVTLPILLTYSETPLQLDRLRCCPTQRALIVQCRSSMSHTGVREALKAYRIKSRAR